MGCSGLAVPEGFEQHELVWRLNASYHSKKILPGSARVAEVNGAVSDIHSSAISGRTENLTAMKIIIAP
jgi:hypothetical protein